MQSDLTSTTSSGATGALAVYDNAPMDPLKARFVAGDTDRVYARTGFLGFVRRTELTQSDGGRASVIDGQNCLSLCSSKSIHLFHFQPYMTPYLSLEV